MKGLLKGTMKLALIAIFVLGVYAISMAGHYAVADTPTPPQNFYGTLKYNGADLPIGTHVKGMVGGTDMTYNGIYATEVEGLYGSSSMAYTQFQVDGANFGDTIIFSVEVSPGNYMNADQTATFDAGTSINLDLTVTTAVCTNGQTQSCLLQQGVCSGSFQTCTGSQWPGCTASDYGPNYQASETWCDGLDNDCDGAIDEGFDVGNSCSAGVGACFASGVKVCSQDKLTTECNAVPGTPTAEVCNNIDDNCNGQTDEGTGGGSCSTGLLGVCSAGTSVCSSGSLSCQQNVLPSAEVCNGLDDDCDGLVDEGGVCGACTNGETQLCSMQQGVCSGSFETCAGGQWPGCTATNYGPNYQSNENLCDGLDNDCDGAVDEGFDVGASCSAGTGVCQASGVKVCSVDKLSSVCNAVAGTPTTEVCDGADNDCDGAIDDDDVCAQSYCITITDIRILDSLFNEVSSIQPGAMYHVRISNENTCQYAVTSMQIVQVRKGQLPVNLATVTSTINPGETSDITAGFVLSQGAQQGESYDVTAFNWNRWIDQPSPPAFEILSATSSTSFTVA